MNRASNMLSRRIALLCATLLLGFAAAAQAADVTLTASHIAGTDWNTTTPVAYWSDGKKASAGNEYWVGTDRSGAAIPGTTMRTPMVDATFPGDALHIGNLGTLAIKANTTPTSTNKYTFNNLIMTDGSTIGQFSDNTTGTINGKITLSGVVKVLDAYVNVRKYQFNAQLVGTGTLQFLMDYAGNDDMIMLNNNTSTYSGAIEQTAGTVKLLSATPLGAATTYTLKSGTNGPATLDPDVDVNCVGTNLVMNSTCKIKLDQKAIFKSVNVNGTALAPGYYTAAALQTSYASYFTNDGGVLIVGAPTPKIAVNPGTTTVTFSNLNVMIQAGDKQTQTITVTNSGSADVTFTKQGAEANQGLVMSGSSFYKILSTSQAMTLPLTPNSSLTITIEFSGATQADYSASGNNTKTAKLSIFSNASGQTRYDIGLTGATTVPVELSTFSAQ